MGKITERLGAVFGGIAKEIKNDQGVKFGIGMVVVLCGAYLFASLIERVILATP